MKKCRNRNTDWIAHAIPTTDLSHFVGTPGKGVKIF